MSSARGLNSVPSITTSILSLPWHAWDCVFFPIPTLTSADDTDGTTFFAPLAYLAATLLTALYFSQVWLFTMSAFGVVWLDSQMAWRAEKLGQAKMQQHITETFERVQCSGSAPTEAREAPAEAVKEPERPVVETIEAPVLEEPVLEEPVLEAAEEDAQPVDGATEAPAEKTGEHVEEVTVPQKADSVNGDNHSQSSGDDEASSNGYSDESRPCSPASSVSSTNDDDVSEQPLEKRQEVRPELEHADSGIGMEMDVDEALVFDKQFDSVVFPSFEAALKTVEPELVFSSAEESLEAALVELLTATSEAKIEEVNIEEPEIEEPEPVEEEVVEVAEKEPEAIEEPEIEVEEPELDIQEKQVAPTLFVDDSTPLLAAHEEIAYEVPEKKVETTFALVPQQLDEKRSILVRSSARSSQPKRVPKKNNGWKRVPKKARLSASAKQRFLSRAFW